ncbi:MAG: hypothetical protein A2017_13510 [Lentisphaerae bacterium GWF2_44_16]|nr:MAG: hypothetical protein A2017_13510 [Lentisphaerae bacterium GWF2_44_16]
MFSKVLETPRCMNMGFHYTRQYSRRSRVNVMGLVDHSTEEWSRWYEKAHGAEAMKKMAEHGYSLMEIHFLYGYGLKGEKEEIELTKKMVSNAHKFGIKVLGYFQFFSVQEELFFLENPWAAKCIQLKSDGKRHEYAYDRPALCFTNKQVQDYYLKGIEIGLKYCDLDGIRLDNDYYKGCYCPNCQKEFRAYLKKNFSKKEARRVFGFEDLSGVSLVPPLEDGNGRGGDPLWSAMVKFRQQQRQGIMKMISDKILSIKPDGILGGNPAVSRKPSDAFRINVYPPDLGKTHHLICSENSLFPARTGASIRHQVTIYKHGQSSDFKVFPSHHLYTAEGRTRWPENMEECALTLCEALCFGGHVPCTTWGLRMDGDENKTLYERPHFIEALHPVRDFLREHQNVYKSAKCSATVGIYMNRESLNSDSIRAWHSIQGAIQLLLANHVPFRFIDEDEDGIMKDLELLIIPDIRLVSEKQLDHFRNFLKTGKILLSGEACLYDEYFLRREKSEWTKFLSSKNIEYLKDCPEKADEKKVEYFHGGNYVKIPFPEKGSQFMKALKSVYKPLISAEGSPFIAIDFFANPKKEYFIHLLNYDNNKPADFSVTINRNIKSAEFYFPEVLGPALQPSMSLQKDSATIKIKKLHTYMVIKFQLAGLP